MTAEQFAVVASAAGMAAAGEQTLILVAIPDLDMFGRPIDQSMWVDETLLELGELFGGATALPATRGSWKDARTGRVTLESVVLVASLAAPASITRGAMRRLGRLMRRFGHGAGQRDVVMMVGPTCRSFHPSAADSDDCFGADVSSTRLAKVLTDPTDISDALGSRTGPRCRSRFTDGDEEMASVRQSPTCKSTVPTDGSATPWRR